MLLHYEKQKYGYACQHIDCQKEMMPLKCILKSQLFLLIWSCTAWQDLGAQLSPFPALHTGSRPPEPLWAAINVSTRRVLLQTGPCGWKERAVIFAICGECWRSRFALGNLHGPMERRNCSLAPWITLLGTQRGSHGLMDAISRKIKKWEKGESLKLVQNIGKHTRDHILLCHGLSA